MSSNLKAIIHEVLNELEEIDEITTTGSIAGYQTPYAFSRTLKNHKNKSKKTAEDSIPGGKVSKYIDEDSNLEDLYENFDYWTFRNDESLSDSAKISKSIKEIKKLVQEAERIVERNLRLKNERKVNSNSYYKRCESQLNTIEETLTRLFKYIKELKG